MTYIRTYRHFPDMKFSKAFGKISFVLEKNLSALQLGQVLHAPAALRLCMQVTSEPGNVCEKRKNI